MFQIFGSIDGVEVLNRAFNRTEGFISDLRNFAPGVATEFYSFENEQFESEGTAGASGKFAPLSKAYAEFKAQEFPGETILKATTHMFESLTRPDAADAIYIAQPDLLAFGTKDPKAIAHHRGLGNLPARPVISLSENQKRRLQKAIQRKLVEYTRQLGFEVDEKAA